MSDDTDENGLERAETVQNEPITDINNTLVTDPNRVLLADMVKKSASTLTATNNDDGYQIVSYK